MNNALLKALKEFFRVVVLAVVPILITSLQEQMIDWRLIGVTAAIAGLRFIDKALHEMGKEQKNKVMTRGLTQF